MSSKNVNGISAPVWSKSVNSADFSILAIDETEWKNISDEQFCSTIKFEILTVIQKTLLCQTIYANRTENGSIHIFYTSLYVLKLFNSFTHFAVIRKIDKKYFIIVRIFSLVDGACLTCKMPPKHLDKCACRV